MQGVQGVCRKSAGSAGGVQAATHGVLASVQGGVQKVQVPCIPCTDGSIISGAGECRECRHTSDVSSKEKVRNSPPPPSCVRIALFEQVFAPK